MNYDQRLKILESRMLLRTRKIPALHAIMALAVDHPAVGNAMDVLADGFYPVFPDEAPVDAPDEQVQFDHLQSLLDEMRVVL